MKKSATVLAKAVTEQQEHVTLGVIRDGKAFIVTKVCLSDNMFINVGIEITIHFRF